MQQKEDFEKKKRELMQKHAEATKFLRETKGEIDLDAINSPGNKKKFFPATVGGDLPQVPGQSGSSRSPSQRAGTSLSLAKPDILSGLKKDLRKSIQQTKSVDLTRNVKLEEFPKLELDRSGYGPDLTPANTGAQTSMRGEEDNRRRQTRDRRRR
jgi:hypothetical protein